MYPVFFLIKESDSFKLLGLLLYQPTTFGLFLETGFVAGKRMQGKKCVQTDK